MRERERERDTTASPSCSSGTDPEQDPIGAFGPGDKPGEREKERPGDRSSAHTSNTSNMTSDSSRSLSLSPSSPEEWHTRALESQKLQKRVIVVHRALMRARRHLAKAVELKQSAQVEDEEIREWKRKLCEQLQLQVEETNRGRSLKLQYIAEKYGV
mmetsp:Transcript_15050/g.15172  ORF Transcript_15050/g.15172 Transcript_15050/m.15172 type:complete len:157 (-) Transcript_15050:165-635(-)